MYTLFPAWLARIPFSVALMGSANWPQEAILKEDLGDIGPQATQARVEFHVCQFWVYTATGATQVKMHTLPSCDEDDDTLSMQRSDDFFKAQQESGGTRPPIGSVAAAHEQQLLRDEIQEMAIALRIAHSRLNALAPISYLPPEIMSCIFSILLEAFAGDASALLHETDNGPSRGQIQMRWVVVTHVCRQWRHMAINTPSLWCHLPLDIGRHWMEAVVERAKPVPLRLTLNTARKVVKPSLCIPQRLRNIRTITIMAEMYQMAKLLSNLTKPAPALETAFLCGACEEESVLPLIVPTPDNLFCGETPNLRTLSFDGCTIPAPIRMSQAAAFAKKRTVRTRRDDLVPSMEQLLDILDRMLMLRSLVLRRCLPLHQAYSHDVPPPRTVSLPNLTMLELAGQVYDCAATLQRLEVPPNVDMCIIGDSRFDSHNQVLKAECVPLLRIVKHHMSGTGSQGKAAIVDSVEVVLGDTISIRTYWSGSPRVRIDIPLPAKDYLELFFLEIPLLEATSLSFQEEPLPEITFSSAQTFWEIFALGNANFEWVQSLTVSDSLIRRVCDAIRSDAFYLASGIPLFVRDTERITRCMFPLLKDVTLHSLRTTIPDELEYVQKKLDEAIRYRNTLGAPLRCLNFSGCTGVEQLVEHLGSVCPSVTSVRMVP
ncbi:hypothetical protein EVG20_g5545 [Dentipellis fragilis]|uniref:Uncharacterized protein n=1 Tax=Dentipellis fragilis TaxID=205917 RepID=A0A4Y9YVE0_9AGAM|nr:hypothetical protein EVG20_g5545 [Dentipellis fragilis]